MKIITVVIVVLLLSVTIPISYLLANNVGFENIRVNKNLIVSSDVDSDGKIYILMYQMYSDQTGYHSANEFVKKHDLNGFTANYNDNIRDLKKSLYLMIKDPRTDRKEIHQLQDSPAIKILALKVLDGKIFLIWKEYENPNGGTPFTNTTIKCGILGPNFSIINVIEIRKATLLSFIEEIISIETLLDPPRIIICDSINQLSSTVYIINGTTVTELNQTFPQRIFKDTEGNLHFLGSAFNSSGTQYYHHIAIDNNFTPVQENNITTDQNPTVFTTKDKRYLLVNQEYYMETKTYIHPLNGSTTKFFDNETQKIDDIDRMSLVPYSLLEPKIIKDHLILFYANIWHYPMVMTSYNYTKNFTKVESRFYNFTITAVQPVGGQYYLVGYQNAWSFKQNFEKIIIERIDN